MAKVWNVLSRIGDYKAGTMRTVFVADFGRGSIRAISPSMEALLARYIRS